MKPVVIFGASAFAEVAHFYFTHDTPREVVAFSVDAPYVKEATYRGLPVVAFEELREAFPPERFALFIALGPHHANRARADKFDEAVQKGYELVSYVSSKADVWPDLVYGPNTFITEGSILLPFVRLGKNVCIWSSGIGHHSTIGDHCMLSAASLTGSVEVGERTFIGVNASVKEGVRIGKRNVIGAGAVILVSTRDDAVHAVRHTRASRVPSHRLRIV
jgi:sugar O-acyltransferase (sialic acid O-acetyltransferase NeuD family)